MGGVSMFTGGWAEDPIEGVGSTTVYSYGQLDAITVDDSLTTEVTADLVKEITGGLDAEVTAGLGMIITDDSLEALIDE